MSNTRGPDIFEVCDALRAEIALSIAKLNVLERDHVKVLTISRDALDERDELRAEVERLTREKEEARRKCSDEIESNIEANNRAIAALKVESVPDPRDAEIAACGSSYQVEGAR